MNVFNRIAMSLLLLLFIVSVLLLSLLPRVVIDWLQAVLSYAELSLDSTVQLAGAVVGLLAAVGAFLLLVAELRPSARQSVVVAQVAGGTAELTNELVALRVRRAAEGIAGIREASPAIHSRGKAIDVLLRLSTDSDIDLPAKTEEVMQAVRTEAESKMGIPIKTLRVTVKHNPRDSRPVASSPATPPKDSSRG